MKKGKKREIRKKISIDEYANITELNNYIYNNRMNCAMIYLFFLFWNKETQN